MQTSNPVLNERAFSGVRGGHGSNVMTVEGTVNKSLILLLLTSVTAYFTWYDVTMVRFFMPALFVALGIAIVLAFKQSLAPYLAPVYAVAEGVVLGGISLFAESRYPGVVFQAVGLTFGVFFCLLLGYKTGAIRLSDRMKAGIMVATGAIFLVYLVNFVLSFFSSNFDLLTTASPLSIGISVVITIVAALNLLLDFEFITKAGRSGSAPQYMEWYASFALLVTLVWLYVEVLRLLQLLSGSRDER